MAAQEALRVTWHVHTLAVSGGTGQQKLVKETGDKNMHWRRTLADKVKGKARKGRKMRFLSAAWIIRPIIAEQTYLA